MRREPLPQCHDGQGVLDWTVVLEGHSKHVSFIHDDVLPPGSSIGVHRHENDEEVYVILSGKGVMTLDGEEHEVGSGDVTVVFPGGSHGLENRSTEDLRILVFAVV